MHISEELKAVHIAEVAYTVEEAKVIHHGSPLMDLITCIPDSTVDTKFGKPS